MEKVNQDAASGETTKGNRIISTIESLMNGENNQKIIENLKFYYDAGRGTRTAIFSENIEESEKQIFMSKATYDKMKDLTNKSAEDKKEYAFIVYGYAKDNEYWIEGLISDLDISDEYREALYKVRPEWRSRTAAVDYNVLLTNTHDSLDGFIEGKQASKEKPLIGLGHTHPRLSNSYGYYSLPDLVNYAQYEEILRGSHEDGVIEHCHIVLAENGDVDCMVFNKNEKRFKKVTDITSFGATEADDVKVPAYTFQPDGILLETDYEKENDESAEDKLYRECIERVISEHRWDNMAK